MADHPEMIGTAGLVLGAKREHAQRPSPLPIATAVSVDGCDDTRDLLASGLHDLVQASFLYAEPFCGLTPAIAMKRAQRHRPTLPRGEALAHLPDHALQPQLVVNPVHEIRVNRILIEHHRARWRLMPRSPARIDRSTIGDLDEQALQAPYLLTVADRLADAMPCLVVGRFKLRSGQTDFLCAQTARHQGQHRFFKPAKLGIRQILSAPRG